MTKKTTKKEVETMDKLSTYKDQVSHRKERIDISVNEIPAGLDIISGKLIMHIFYAEKYDSIRYMINIYFTHKEQDYRLVTSTSAPQAEKWCNKIIDKGVLTITEDNTNDTKVKAINTYKGKFDFQISSYITQDGQLKTKITLC